MSAALVEGTLSTLPVSKGKIRGTEHETGHLHESEARWLIFKHADLRMETAYVVP
jgi:hypothetical protein